MLLPYNEFRARADALHAQIAAACASAGREPHEVALLAVTKTHPAAAVDYAARYGEAAKDMAGWLAQGRLKSREDIVEGFDTFPDALLKLFRGENTGKLLLKIG